MRGFRRSAPSLSAADAAERDRRQALASAHEAAHGWWHSIDLGYGVVTNGYKTAAHLRDEIEAMQFPDVRGKSVLDIGAWDGFYSFEAERRGARRVVALDYFVWCLDLPAQHGYVQKCREEGVQPQPYERVPGLWRPDELPGKRGFDLAYEVLESKVEVVVADFTTVDVDALGTFDVVIFMGVLYHLKDPIATLERVRKLTGALAVIETEAMEMPRGTEHELWESYSADQLHGDITNWWVPNQNALVGMCRAVGFSDVRVTRGQKDLNPNAVGPQHYRLFVHSRV